jgi:hypothetical protein
LAFYREDWENSMWRPWERKATPRHELPNGRLLSEQEVDALVTARAEALAKQLIATMPKPKTEHVVKFSDLREVDGYVVREVGGAPWEFRKPLVVTDDREKALACMRADPKACFLKVAKLWKTPSGTLLWKVEAQVAWPAFEEVNVDG